MWAGERCTERPRRARAAPISDSDTGNGWRRRPRAGLGSTRETRGGPLLDGAHRRRCRARFRTPTCPTRRSEGEERRVLADELERMG